MSLLKHKGLPLGEQGCCSKRHSAEAAKRWLTECLFRLALVVLSDSVPTSLGFSMVLHSLLDS